MYEEYRVAVDIYPLKSVDGITSVLHVGKGENTEVYGGRNPAIFLQHESGQSTILISSSVNGNPTFEVSLPGPPTGQWTSVVIKQVKEQF